MHKVVYRVLWRLLSLLRKNNNKTKINAYLCRISAKAVGGFMGYSKHPVYGVM
jgi:hypothetical protein